MSNNLTNKFQYAKPPPQLCACLKTGDLFFPMSYVLVFFYIIFNELNREVSVCCVDIVELLTFTIETFFSQHDITGYMTFSDFRIFSLPENPGLFPSCSSFLRSLFILLFVLPFYCLYFFVLWLQSQLCYLQIFLDDIKCVHG